MVRSFAPFVTFAYPKGGVGRRALVLRNFRFVGVTACLIFDVLLDSTALRMDDSFCQLT